MKTKEEAEGALIQKGLDEGLLSYPSGERDYDIHPYLEESEKRETMIRSALDTFVQGGFKYFFCIMELRSVLPGGLLYNKVSVVVRGA